MYKVRHLETGLCELYLKLELANPAGSVKDRIGLSMIEEAELRGDIKPGDTLVEATAGNTGLGLALVAAQKGYQLVLVIPDKMSQEKVFNCRAMGAEVILTRSDVAKGHPEYYQDLAQSIAEDRGAYYVNQFGNPDNPKAHYTTTAPEIRTRDGGLTPFLFVICRTGAVPGPFPGAAPPGVVARRGRRPASRGGRRRWGCRWNRRTAAARLETAGNPCP